MTRPDLFCVTCADAQGGHRMAYWQWGDARSAHVVLCVHGLSRQGRDFDVLAQAIVARAGGDMRVVCPDVVGRGHSDWLRDPTGYQIPAYAADMLALLAPPARRAPIATLDWVGTSMGGLIGMVGRRPPRAAAAGAGAPAGAQRRRPDDRLGGAAAHRHLPRPDRPLRHAAAGRRCDVGDVAAASARTRREQWLALSRHMVSGVAAHADGAPGRRGEHWPTRGPLLLHYDPAIAVPFRAATPEAAAQGEAALWQLYDNITAPTLLLRGAQSDLLSPETAHR